MNCRNFARILADFHEGALSREERAAAEAHLEICSACRRLRDIARGSIDILPRDGSGELTRAILDQTSGPVCPRVETGLWDYVRGELNRDDSELIESHLDHCTGCRSVAGNLAMMQQMLPAMAEMDPGESFTREVLRATSKWHPGQSSLPIRLRNWWNRTVQRPRFSLEAAYLGTLILVFCFSSFSVGFRHITSAPASSATNQPMERYLYSMWTDVQAPISNELRKFSSVAALQRKAVSESLSKRIKLYGNVSASTLDKKFENIRGWSRKATGALLVSWTHLSGWIPQSGK